MCREIAIRTTTEDVETDTTHGKRTVELRTVDLKASSDGLTGCAEHCAEHREQSEQSDIGGHRDQTEQSDTMVRQRASDQTQ